MSDSFFNLPLRESQALIGKAAAQMDVSDLIIEKDLWVCWVLEQLFSLPIHMIFKGGTSLSKVFQLIKRFSEDCDITIDYRMFMQEVDLNTITRSQLKKVSKQLKKQLQAYVSETILPYLQYKVCICFPNQDFEITLSEDGERLRFYYPSIIHSLRGYLRDHVLVEFGIRSSTEPCEKHLITPYLKNVINEIVDLPAPVVDVLSPIRTFWEKITLIHVECHRDRFVKTSERLSRHWYDLFLLNNSWVGKQAVRRNDIFKNVLEHKKAFFNASYADYDSCWRGALRLIPASEDLSTLASDFKQMIDAGMFYEDPPAFIDIIHSLSVLEVEINNHQRQDTYIKTEKVTA